MSDQSKPNEVVTFAVMHRIETTVNIRTGEVLKLEQSFEYPEEELGPNPGRNAHLLSPQGKFLGLVYARRELHSLLRLFAEKLSRYADRTIYSSFPDSDSDGAIFSK